MTLPGASRAARLAAALETAAALPPAPALGMGAAWAGRHGRRRAGRGDEFWQFRQALPGDHAAMVDWRRSARSQDLFVRETEWAGAQTIFLWPDPSPSMSWRSHRDLPLKRDRAVLLSLALAAYLLRAGERIALPGNPQPPVLGIGGLERLDAMIQAQDPAGPVLPRPKAPPAGSRFVLISDFLMPAEQAAEAIAALAARAETGHVLQVLDPEEESFPYKGRTLFSGLEGEADLVLPRAQSVQDDYQAALRRRRDRVAAAAASHGWSFAQHHTDRPPLTALIGLAAQLSGAA